LTPSNPSIPLGLSQQFTATGTYSDGSSAVLTKDIVLSTSGVTASILQASGLATSKAVGAETITATLGKIIGTTKLIVLAPYAGVTAGSSHSVVLIANGSIYGSGLNRTGQLGDGTSTDRSEFTAIGTVNFWSTISAGEFHTAAIRSDGSLWT